MTELHSSFIDRTRRLLGDDYPRFEQALATESPVSIRLNPAKCRPGGPLGEAVPWSQEGYYLPERPAFTFDPCFHAGAYYVQEAASMFLHRVIDQYIHTPVRYLDLCAAPGGKSTDAIASLPAGSLVVSNEVVPNRTYILAENLTKWGSPFSVVTRNEAADFARLESYFDVVATDVPCSGEGMFRKDPDAIAEWSPTGVDRCAERQQQILTDVWPALKPGGVLIYSTCTYNLEENEEMVHFLMKHFGATPLDAAPPEEWHIHPSLDADLPAYRFMPHYTRGEGLFMAALRKPGDEDDCERDSWLRRSARRQEKKKTGRPAAKDDNHALRSWILSPDDYLFDTAADTVTALPAAYAADHALFATRFDVVHRGIPVATPKGREWLPHPSLALSTHLNREAFDTLSLTQTGAIVYLRRESPTIMPDSRRGIRLVACDNVPLGWCNHLGNRINNLYPPEWRIRSGYLPDNPNLPVW